jgi:exosortase/archaeosortase family protein
VTYMRPAGIVPAGRLSERLKIGRAGVFAAGGVLAALNAQADPLILAVRYQPILVAFVWLGGISAVTWFAMFAALKVGLEGQSRPLSGRDTTILAIVTFFAFIPAAYAGGAGVLLAGSYLFATSRSGAADRRVALVLLALTGPLVWGHVILNLFAAPILALDAHMVGAAIGSSVDGNVVRFAGSEKSFLIGGPCSSVHNISLAIVLWASAASLFSIRLDRRYVAVGLAMIAWMFLLNIGRLATIGWFPGDFEYLHDGYGAALFGFAGLIGAALLVGVGVVSADKRQG